MHLLVVVPIGIFGVCHPNVVGMPGAGRGAILELKFSGYVGHFQMNWVLLDHHG
jgi:hypothetical protein